MAEQMRYTPGPWRVVEKERGWREIWAGNRAVVRADGYYSAKYEEYECGVAISEPNARRIVAAVNACEDAGLSTEALESGMVREMVEALEVLLPSIEDAVGEIYDWPEYERAKAVLAKVRGDAQAHAPDCDCQDCRNRRFMDEWEQDRDRDVEADLAEMWREAWEG